MYTILKAFLFLVVFNACTNKSANTKGTATLAKLSYEDMNSFEAQSEGFGESYIKFVVFVNDKDLSIEYFDSNKIKLHLDFLKSVKGVTLSSEEIYKQARFNEGRKYYFGALIRQRDGFTNVETLSFQLTSQDILPIDDIVRIGKIIQASFEEPEDISYMPSGNQAKAVSELSAQKQLELAGFPVLQIDAFQSKTYYAATVPGRLKKVTAKEIEDGVYHVKGDEILLLDHVPDSLPPVRGVIMYCIPFVYVQNAFESKELAALDGKLLLFKTYSIYDTNDPYLAEVLTESTYKSLETLWLNRFPQVNISLDIENLNTLNNFIVIGSGDTHLNVGTCGAKATNGNILVETIGSKNSIEGFCIPFYYFNKFLQTNTVGSLTLKDYILSEINKISSQTKLEEVQAILNNIEEHIALAKVPSDDLDKLKTMIKKTYEAKTTVSKIRFRSSSNAEDDERFNGAGLYESDGLKLEHVYKNRRVFKNCLVLPLWSSRCYGEKNV
jgi:hypothetical protein